MVDTIHQRWMILKDMDFVVDIENLCFEFPWNWEDFRKTLRCNNTIGMVTELDETVIGYMVYELHPNRLHLMNLAVHPDFQRQGVGKAMIDWLKSKLNHERRNRITLHVRETNLSAQLFFRDMGFRATRVLRDFYDDVREDAYQMVHRLDPISNKLQVTLD